MRVELRERLQRLRAENKLLEAQRLEQRTMYDLELLEEMGFCPGIENYSRHLTGRAPGEPPPTLINYFPDDYLLVIDESHVTVPQIGGMYRGDRSRKETLVDFGFRLPSALDNRPLNFEEFEALTHQVVYVSATPGEYERSSRRCPGDRAAHPPDRSDRSGDAGPAGAAAGRRSVGRDPLPGRRNERVLVTTLTKKMAEDLTDYYQELGVKVRYLHSDIETIERVEIIRDLRRGGFDVLVGINLLREGLDLPEVSLVAILDADKEGYLRSERSLIQTIGRAARNVNGTRHPLRRAHDRSRCAPPSTRPTDGAPSSSATTRSTASRRRPSRRPSRSRWSRSSRRTTSICRGGGGGGRGVRAAGRYPPPGRRSAASEMREAAAALEFERAADLRDEIQRLQDHELALRDAP